MEKATGDWIVFLDADDILLCDGLESKLAKISLLDAPSIGGVYGGFVWSDTEKVQRFLVSNQPAKADCVGIVGRVPGGAPSYILRKKALVEVGGFDTSLDFNEDIDLILRMVRSGWEFYGVSEPGFIRTVNPNSHTRFNKKKALTGSRKFLRKAWRERLMSRREISRRYLLNFASALKTKSLEWRF